MCYKGKALAKGDETQEEPEGGGGHDEGGRQRQVARSHPARDSLRTRTSWIGFYTDWGALD